MVSSGGGPSISTIALQCRWPSSHSLRRFRPHGSTKPRLGRTCSPRGRSLGPVHSPAAATLELPPRPKRSRKDVRGRMFHPFPAHRLLRFGCGFGGQLHHLRRSGRKICDFEHRSPRNSGL
jgi:hypothetical protein